jgi:predicted porin
MRGLRAAAASAAAILLGGAGGAYAADLDTATKSPVLKAPAVGPAICTNIVDFFTTACQLAWYGVRFYGTIDVGYGYQTNGAPWNNAYGPGSSYVVGKPNKGAMWLLSPNGLNQSNIGIQIKEPLGGGWSFIGQLEAGFDPYSLNLASGPGALHQNVGVPLALQTSSGDAPSQGKFYNNLGYVGVSSDTYGTITVFRQGGLGADAAKAYDPMGGAYAFSAIGFLGAAAGGGDTENKAATTSVKYRVNIGNVRAAAFAQFGGYDLGNASKGAYQGDLGADFNIGRGVLSVDAVGGYAKDAVFEALIGPTDKFGNPNLISTNQVLTATISDNTSVMALAKYTLDKLQLYAAYAWMQFAPPSDTFANLTGFDNIAGDLICASCNIFNGTNINNTAYNARDKILQIVWAGAKYSLTDSIDVAAAYYHFDQNDYSNGSASKAGGTCALAKTAQVSCAGTLDAASALIDWKFAPKWDTYVGTMFSQMNGGMDSGFASRNNLATTAGVRFRW